MRQAITHAPENFSLYEPEKGHVRLTPAYDLINAAILNPKDDEELDGKKKRLSTSKTHPKCSFSKFMNYICSLINRLNQKPNIQYVGFQQSK